MNRFEEYNEMMKELETVPSGNSVRKAVRRRKITRLFRNTLSSLAAVFLVFAGTINLAPAAAAACWEIPFLQELTDLLLFRPSIRMAVENHYLQVIDQEQSKSNITARIEYLVVDQKQVNVYYRLKSKQYQALTASPEVRDVNGDFAGASVMHGGLYEENEELREIVIDFTDDNVPSVLNLTLKVHDNGSFVKTEEAAPSDTDNVQYDEPEMIDEFVFRIEFDPYFTEQGKRFTLNKKAEIDGQTLKITGMEVYPSHIRINIEENEENSALIQSLRFYLELDNGNHLETISNGITSTKSENTPLLTSYRAESNYFENAETIHLKITGADFLDKEHQQVHLNLETMECDYLPEGVKIKEAHRTGNGWELTFMLKKTEESHVQLLSGTYQDDAGEEYYINRYSTRFTAIDDETDEEIEGWEEESYYLDDFKSDTVTLNLNYNRFWNVQSPVVIELQ